MFRLGVRRRLILIVSLGIVSLGVAAYTTLRRDPLGAALEVARLAPLPASARAVVIEGAPGQHQAAASQVRFSASPAEIEKWLRESPSVRGALINRRGSHRDFLLAHNVGGPEASMGVDDDGHVVVMVEPGE